ncbi:MULTISPECIES: DUF3299 domain-containing protein [Larkinella]|jgi:hypothetical protein|uniref:DUF3299 domain-containing protein n=2 Tax=Larkinella TaxID=332157 RepID=A0A5N1JTG3_9BACT|nr:MULTISPECIES: DUF3299 domain-containing protein [Larkinella]KAA9357073.1 DUF3299 domain-containing protein [Larkinella humicola]RCR70810.1 DUF3299 domain-containing protein [Larkinella punicea]
MKKNVCFIALLGLLTLAAFTPAKVVSNRSVATVAEPVKLSWETLRDVTFKKKWYPEESVYMLYPTFGAGIQKLSGKPVELTGYVLPVDYESNLYVLSAFPYSACFFCGGAGPESVVSLKFKKNGLKFKTDERRTFRGTLKLNADNIYELNYIIADAEMVEQ